ncbi:MAG TPA: hypothetical protein PKY25_03580 [Bacilli bacterium]|nr:hypothetical protein [Bacilli bacterium]
MNNNYDEILDIILTFVEDEDISNKLIYSGDIIPFLIKDIESNKYHNDIEILVEFDDMRLVRKTIYNLSKEFDFEILLDTNKVTTHDYGFRIKYDNTVISIHPYSIKKNNLYIRSFTISQDMKKVIQKLRKIPNFNETDAFRTLEIKDNKIIKIITPEFLLSDLESKDNTDKKIIEMLYKISDKKLLKITKKAIQKTETTLTEEEIKPKIIDQNIIIIALIIIVITILILMVVF